MATLNHQPLIRKLLLSVVAMFGFGFALVPLYDVFCQITGINGKTSNEAASGIGVQTDSSRTVLVQFLAHPDSKMPWAFAPELKQIAVHPGEITLVHYSASNPTAYQMTAQAVPSVSPGQAALYFNKMECFCFTRQQLTAGGQIQMPLRFYIDPALPVDINTITLSYTLYDVTQRAQTLAAGQTERGK